MGGRPKVQAAPPPPTVNGTELDPVLKQQQTQAYLKQTSQLQDATTFAGKNQQDELLALKKRGLLGMFQ